MAELIMVAGGSRSGKSAFAQGLLNDFTDVTYVATLQNLDHEMDERIKLHQQNRPQNWQTIEEFYDLGKIIGKISKNTNVVLIDCYTGFLSNLLLKESENTEKITHKELENILGFVDNNLRLLSESQIEKIIIVTNETGCGVIPAFELGRVFADLQGWANQKLALYSNEVYFLEFGIARRIK